MSKIDTKTCVSAANGLEQCQNNDIASQAQRNTQEPTPDEVIVYWQERGTCLFCRCVIRHAIHLFNHWNKWHRYARTPVFLPHRAPQEKPRFYYFSKRYHEWFQLADFRQYLTFKSYGFATAYTKEKKA